MSFQRLLGFHAITARLHQAPESLVRVYYDSQRRDKRLQRLLDQLRQAQVELVDTDKAELKKLAGDGRHQGVMGMARPLPLATDIFSLLEALSEQKKQPLLLILDGVTDPHNLGACLRTADAAGVHAVLAPKDRAASLTPVARRVACGAAETVPYLQVTNLARTMRALQKEGVWLLGADGQAEQSLHEVDLKERAIAWVMGAEGEGLRRLTKEQCDEFVRIPMLGAVESLNVSVATALCLYESVRQRA